MFFSFYKFRQKANLLSQIAFAALLLNGCKSQEKQQVSQENLGSYGTTTLKMSELNAMERDELYNAQKKVYDTAQTILEKRYLDSWFADYQAKNKLASLDDAKKDYFSKNANVPDEAVQKFIKENAANPQLQQIPVMERATIVQQYLSRASQEKSEQAILAKAEGDGLIKVEAFKAPTTPTIKFAAGGYVYDPSLKNAKVTITEFADYQCPYCVKANATVKEVLKEYKGRVQFVFRDFPLTSIHPEAMPAAIAAKCAGAQGQYWEMHNKLFDREPMAPLSAASYTNFAEQFKLNKAAFAACQADPAQKQKVEADMDEAVKIGVNSTPTFYINGQKFEHAQELASFEQEINRKLAE